MKPCKSSDSPLSNTVLQNGMDGVQDEIDERCNTVCRHIEVKAPVNRVNDQHYLLRAATCRKQKAAISRKLVNYRSVRMNQAEGASVAALTALRYGRVLYE